MKHKNIFCLLTFLLITVVIFSCKKFLDEKPDKSLVVPRSVGDLQAILDDNDIMNARTPGFGETSADDYFVQLSDYNSFGDFDQRAYTWRLQTYNYGNDWNYAYNAIYNANYCLEQVDKIKKTSQTELKWKNVKGSALFYRAYYFLDLCWEYAKAYDENTSSNDLGIILRLGSDFNVPSVRASVKESYKQVIKDLTEANLYLPDNPEHPMRPSKAASYATLARAYLSMRKYDSAFKYTNLSLQIKSDLLDYNSSDVSPAADIPFQPFNKEIIFYTTQSGNYTPKAAAFAAIDTTLYAGYDDNDLRKSAFFYFNNGYMSFKGSYSSASYPLFSGITTDELLLTRAECYARANRTAEALNDLNTLLAKRWITGTFTPYTATDATEALKKIVIERRKELLMRGLRWIDIKRLNKEDANLVLKRIVGAENYTLAPNDKKYALPLPNDIIIQTGVPQN